MFTRSLIAGSALLGLIACGTHRYASSVDAAALRGPGPVTMNEKRFTDEKGNKLTLRLDEASRAEPLSVVDKDGKELPIHSYDLNQASVCLPSSGGGSKPCQPVASMTEGAFLKIGAATCTCTTVFGRLKCYGDTCP